MSAAGSVRKDTSGKWVFVVDVPGEDGRRQQIKRRGFTTRKAAETAMTAVKSSVDTGTFVRPTKVTVATYLTAWHASLAVRGLARLTIESYGQIINRNIIPYIGTIELAALTTDHVDALYARLLGNNRLPHHAGGKTPKALSKRSVRYAHVILTGALAEAETKGKVIRNVARASTPPSAASAKAPEMGYWTPDELARFLTTIGTNPLYPLVRLAAMSGLRRGELCGLRWSDLDLDFALVSVRQQVITGANGTLYVGPLKTKKSRRTIDIDARTVATLKSWRTTQIEQRLVMGSGWNDTGFVFTDTTGTGWKPDTITSRFDGMVTAPADAPTDALRPPRIRFHDLRHTHASHLLGAGVNPKVVSERLGHSSVAFTLDTYAHVMPGQQAAAAAAVADLVFGVAR